MEQLRWRVRWASLSAAVGVATAAAAVPNVAQVVDGLPQIVAPQQLIVSCSPSVLQSVCDGVLASVGAVVIATGQAAFNLVALPDGIALQDALDVLRASTAIASAEPNRILIGSTSHPQTWHFPSIQAPGDATLLPAGASPIVAVLDTGIAYEDDWTGFYAKAPVFAGTQFARGWDFVNNDCHPDDDNGHGTAMASIIAGSGTFEAADVPYVGPSSGATLMPVKVLDANNQGTEFWLAEGIRFAVQSGARVINLSLDFARNYVPGAALRSAIAAARAANVVVVAAAGNTGDGRVLYPAAFPDAISVGAFTLDASAGYAMTPYSNSGDALDVAGPGGTPDKDVNQDGLWDGVLAQSFPPDTPSDPGWWLFAGTSPATAHVSAAAAALIGNGADPAEVRPALQTTAAALGGASGWTPAAGSGRVQAGAAIALATGSWRAPAPLYADAVAALRSDGRAGGAVMIADASGNGVSNVEVHARWRGAASASQIAVTDWAGIARFVSPRPSSSRRIFLLEVPRVIARGVPQRPRAFARSGGGFSSLAISLSLPSGGPVSSIDGLGIWGYGYSQSTGLASGTTGSGLASGTTGSTGSGSPPSYPLTSGINLCVLPFQTYTYGPLSFSASWGFFSGALLSTGYSVRAIDSSWVLAPGAAAIDATELATICGGLGVTAAKSLSGSYFASGTLYVAGSGSPPAGMGAGDSVRFWSEVMNAEGSTAP
jgi:serine protease